jgi:predicted phage terminase large subunit-like protein
MTRHRIAQIGKNRNPKSPETGPEPAVSCGNDYFRRAPRPPCSTAWRFFTADYLLDVYRQRLDYPDLKRKVHELAKRDRPYKILIEDKASGTQLIQELRAQGLYAVTAYQPPSGTDKIMRLHAQTARFENGQVLLPTRASWLADYVTELTSFPGSRHDDQVDSTTQALDHLRTHERNPLHRIVTVTTVELKRPGPVGIHAAATEPCHCTAASALKIRSVDREMR